MKTALLVVTHGSKTHDALIVFEKLVDHIRQKEKYEIIAGAYMEFADPGILETIDNIAKKKPDVIIIAPYFLYEGMHIKKDIPEIIEKASAKYPDIKFKYARPIGYESALADIILARAAEAEKTDKGEI